MKEKMKIITIKKEDYPISDESCEKEYLVENLSMLVSSGMDFSSALATLKEEMKTRAMKKVLTSIQEDIDAGSSFWRALGSAKIFAQHTISLVRIGEESGRLSENLKIIAIQEEKDRDFKSKIHSAMMYPVFVLILFILRVYHFLKLNYRSPG